MVRIFVICETYPQGNRPKCKTITRGIILLIKLSFPLDNNKIDAILPTMAARKKDTDFNDYFDSLWEYARSQKMSKGQFMKLSGLSPQRFSEFSQKTRNITGEYFLKMIGGLGLTPEDLERESGKPFSEDQMIQLRFDGFVNSQRAFIEELMKDPVKLSACKAIVRLKGLWNNPSLKKLYSKLSGLKKSSQQQSL